MAKAKVATEEVVKEEEVKVEEVETTEEVTTEVEETEDVDVLEIEEPKMKAKKKIFTKENGKKVLKGLVCAAGGAAATIVALVIATRPKDSDLNEYALEKQDDWAKMEEVSDSEVEETEE